MLEVITDMHLYEILKYSGLDTDKSSKNIFVLKFEKISEGADNILPVVLSDINKGYFEGWSKGHLETTLMHLSFAQVKKMNDQQNMLEDITLKLSDTDSKWFRTYNKDDIISSCAWFYVDRANLNEYFLAIQKNCLLDRQIIAKIIRPFLAPSQISEVVNQIMNYKYNHILDS